MVTQRIRIKKRVTLDQHLKINKEQDKNALSKVFANFENRDKMKIIILKEE